MKTPSADWTSRVKRCCSRPPMRDEADQVWNGKKGRKKTREGCRNNMDDGKEGKKKKRRNEDESEI